MQQMSIPEECLSEWKHPVKNEVELKIRALEVNETYTENITLFSDSIGDSLKKPYHKLVAQINKAMEMLWFTKDFVLWIT